MKEKLKFKEVAVYAFFVTIIIFSFLGFYGLLNAGRQWVDDHEIIRMRIEITSLRKMLSCIYSDIYYTGRFRPLYMFFRIVRSHVIYDGSMLVWHILNAVVVCADAVLAYMFSRNLGIKKLESVLFSVITMCGKQCEIWWRLGPQEQEGLLLLLTALVLIQEYRRTDRKLLLAGSVFASVLMSWQKESFLVLIPFCMLFALAEFMNSYGEQLSVEAVLKTIKRHKAYYISMTATLIADLMLIFWVVGKGSSDGKAGIGYAGVEMTWSVFKWAVSFIKLFVDIWYYLLICAVCLAGYIFWHRKTEHKGRSMIYACSFAVLICSQFVLYAKSGMEEGRYLVPLSLSIAFFVSSAIDCIRQRNLRIVATGLIIGLCVFNIRYSEPDEYIFNGKDTEAFISYYAEHSLQGNESIAVNGPREAARAFSSYLYEQSRFPNTYWVDENGDCIPLKWEQTIDTPWSAKDADYLMKWGSDEENPADYTLEMEGYQWSLWKRK